jgi:hypothetical protein
MAVAGNRRAGLGLCVARLPGPAFLEKRSVVHGEAISPWNPEFVYYLVVSAACVSGGYFFTQGDLLVAKKFFSGGENDAYNCAERLAAALPIAVAPCSRCCSPPAPARARAVSSAIN